MMNIIRLGFALLLLFSFKTLAQNKEKIKGNREVTIKKNYVEPFNRIVVGDRFEIEIIFNAKPSVEIEADSNLHDVIMFEVIDSTLSFKTTHRITSKKALKITVNYTNTLKDIETQDNGEIRSLTSLELNNNDVTLKTSGNSRAYLNINSKTYKQVSLDKSKVKLNLTTNSTTLELSDNAKMDALINTNDATIDLYQRAIINLEGQAKTATIRTDNNSDFNGRKFSITNCNLICEVASDAYVEALESITMEIMGNSEVYLYGNPSITLEKFTDSAKLQKKETN